MEELGEKEAKQSIHAYLEIIGFINFLMSDVANHVDPDKSMIYLFGAEERMKIPIVYQSASIENKTAGILNSLAVINGLMDGESHRKDKAHQLKAILIDTLKGSEEASRFDFLIKELEAVAKRFAHNHELFVSGFSFDDSRETLNKENREFTRDLNNVISSIHSRIIGIPVGTVLPAFLIKSSKLEENSFSLETLILLSAVFMSIVIAFSLVGQYNLLLKVRREYKAKWQRMKTQIPNLEKGLSEEFDDLEKSYRLNKFLLVFFGIALLLFFLVPLNGAKTLQHT